MTLQISPVVPEGNTLTPEEARFVETLADRLVTQQTLFLIGSGLSLNWGQPSVGKLVEALKADADKDRQALVTSINELDKLTERLAYNKCRFMRDFLSLMKRRGWMPAYKAMQVDDPVKDRLIGRPHIVLGRLAKEGLMREVLTTNYDCLIEAGCWAVGMDRVANETAQGIHPMPWVEQFRVVADHHDYWTPLANRRLFQIHKIHGCIDAAYSANESTPCTCTHLRKPRGKKKSHLTQDQLNFVITFREMLHWREDHWARDLFADRVRSHQMVLLGYSSTDIVTHSTFRDLFEEMNERHVVSKGRAQAVAIDLNQFNLTEMLRAAGSQAAEYYFKLPADEPTPAVEDLFTRLYVRVIRSLLARRLIINGPAVVEPALRRAGVEQNPKRVRQLNQNLLTRVGLDDVGLPGSPRWGDVFWFETLPAAVRLSWRATFPLLGRGYDFEEKRLRRPHYYVPLGYTDEMTFPLLAVYGHLAASAMDGNLHSLGGGWVHLLIEGKPVSVLPILAPDLYNLANMLINPYQLLPPAGTEGQARRLLVITPTATGAPDLRLLGQENMQAVYLSSDKVYDNDGGAAVKAALLASL